MNIERRAKQKIRARRWVALGISLFLTTVMISGLLSAQTTTTFAVTLCNGDTQAAPVFDEETGVRSATSDAPGVVSVGFTNDPGTVTLQARAVGTATVVFEIKASPTTQPQNPWVVMTLLVTVVECAGDPGSDERNKDREERGAGQFNPVRPEPDDEDEIGKAMRITLCEGDSGTVSFDVETALRNGGSSDTDVATADFRNGPGEIHITAHREGTAFITADAQSSPTTQPNNPWIVLTVRVDVVACPDGEDDEDDFRDENDIGELEEVNPIPDNFLGAIPDPRGDCRLKLNPRELAPLCPGIIDLELADIAIESVATAVTLYENPLASTSRQSNVQFGPQLTLKVQLHNEIMPDGVLPSSPDTRYQFNIDVDNNPDTGLSTHYWPEDFGADVEVRLIYVSDPRPEFFQLVRVWNPNDENWQDFYDLALFEFGEDTSEITISIPLDFLNQSLDFFQGTEISKDPTNWIALNWQFRSDIQTYVADYYPNDRFPQIETE